MWFDTKYDDKEIECAFCHKKVKPILEKNIWTLGKLIPIVGWWRVKRIPPKEYIKICPNCKAIIGTK
ncbi:MAG: hypothetical protein NTV74_06865 [Euryarchaeota archaeon]|nr:hypothetical protein [Euryarchaeota archaeon]